MELESLNDLIEFCEWLEVMEDLFTAQHRPAEPGCNAKTGQKGGNRGTLAYQSALGSEEPAPKQ